MIYKKIFLNLSFIIAILNLPSCNSQSCIELPTQFSSYQEAVNEVKSTDFTFEEDIDTSRSSLIKSAAYYSCDSKVGFLLVKIRGTDYIYQNVPIAVWQQFKNADSFGGFFNKKIKNKYLLYLNN